VAAAKRIVFVIFSCDAWGHALLRHVASGLDEAYDWCESHGSAPRYEMETDSDGNRCIRLTTTSKTQKGRHYSIHEVPLDGDYKA
jgi:hypothetical protein